MKFTLLLVALCCVIGSLECLECGIDSTASQKDLKQIAENCMKNKADDKKKSVSEDGEEEEEVKESTTETALKRSKRNDDDKKSQKSQNSQNSQNSQKNKQDDELISTGNNNSSSSGKNNCVMQCIFGQMGLTDGNGFPVHHRLSDALLKNAKSRELRDFIQDTTDECFQLMEQGDNQDSCTYSVTLVNCLAERGKSNCADWPIGNLSFLTGKN